MLLGSVLAKSKDCANEFFGRSIKCPNVVDSFVSQFDQMCSSLSNPFLVNTEANLLPSCKDLNYDSLCVCTMPIELIISELSECLQMQLLCRITLL